MKSVKRLSSGLLRRRLREFPAVAIAGPRQCGKTTLARTLPGEYFDLEQESDRLRLDLSWDRLAAGRRLVILDEAQAWPPVFPRLRGEIDRNRGRNGRFLLLGSVGPHLMKAVSESLAGRLALLELTPLLLAETGATNPDRLWLRGGYPDGGILRDGGFPEWQRNYLELLMSRDLPAWGMPAGPQLTMRMARMLAALHGQMWNASEVGRSLGLSYHTVSGYLDYLEGAFLVRRLLPYSANIGKRLVKSPKVYWRDSGLLHSMLGANTMDELLTMPRVGASWEGFVIGQILGTLSARGTRVEPYFVRTSDQHELDLLLKVGRQLVAFGIKLTSNPSPADMSRLVQLAGSVGAHKSCLVSRVARATVGDQAVSCPLPWLLANLSKVVPA